MTNILYVHVYPIKSQHILCLKKVKNFMWYLGKFGIILWMLLPFQVWTVSLIVIDQMPVYNRVVPVICKMLRHFIQQHNNMNFNINHSQIKVGTHLHGATKYLSNTIETLCTVKSCEIIIILPFSCQNDHTKTEEWSWL